MAAGREAVALRPAGWGVVETRCVGRGMGAVRGN